MKIVLIIYVISWLILLAVFISSLFSKNKSRSNEKTPWYVYAAIILLAPLAVFIIPYLLYSDYRDNKREKKLEAEREEKKRIQKVKKETAMTAFKSAFQSEADYATIGKHLHKLAIEKSYNSFLECLDKIHLPPGAKLLVEECHGQTNDIGDESKLLIKLPDGRQHEDIFNYLTVEQSSMGAWQSYLLYKLWHVLPLFWHGNYYARDYIFTKEDIKDISIYNEEDKDYIINTISSFDCTPEVREKDSNYFISCCFFSNFGGLIREFVEISINDGKVTELYDFDKKTVFDYNCGILF